MKSRFIIGLFVLLGLNLYASHNKGGVITWEHVGGFSYKFTIWTWTEINSPGGNADRCKLTLHINGVDSLVLPRVNGPAFTGGGSCAGTNEGLELGIPANTKQNIYQGTYIFPCKGQFKVYMYDPNRNAGVVNIPSSVNQPFYIESEIVVPDLAYPCAKSSSTIEFNGINVANSPNQKFYAFAMNTYGDSLVYSLVPCKGVDQFNNIGVDIPGYSSSGFSINPITGEITSNISTIGEYGLCYKIKKYRNQEYIGCLNYDFIVRMFSGSSFTFSGFTSNMTPVNGVYQLSSSQTFTLSGTNSASINCNYSLFSELGGSTQSLSVNYPSFSLSVTYSASMARNEPYKLYIKGRNVSAPGLTNDTLIRIKFLGAPSNTCGIMGITTTTCLTSIKENPSDHFAFKLYPTITPDRLRLEGSYKSIGIMDVSGKLLKPLSLENDLLNVENFANGVYILIVKDLNNRDHYYKFVKN